jgi:hypothetical protein
MNDGWEIARRNFTDDDGSLPGIEFQNLLPTRVRSIVNYFFEHGRMTPEDSTLWHKQLQATVPIGQIDDPASLVLTGVAEPFHCCFQLDSPGLESIPVLGLFVFPDLVEIDFRMGSDWNAENVDSFFRVLAHLKSLAPEANVESAEREGLPFPEDFKTALGRYSGTNTL